MALRPTVLKAIAWADRRAAEAMQMAERTLQVCRQLVDQAGQVVPAHLACTAGRGDQFAEDGFAAADLPLQKTEVIGLNKIKGKPFDVAEVVDKINAILDEL